jgi:uncharacterized repeat protein (TIGR01451 family)
VSDRVPELAEVLDAQTDGGTCGHTGNDVVCNVGALPPGGDATVTIRARATAPGSSENVTVVGVTPPPLIPALPGAPAGTPIDPLRDNVARARIAAIVPSLSLSKFASPRRVRRGDMTSFTLRVKNGSREPLTDVVVCDRLGRRFGYVDAHPASRAVGQRRCWRIASLGPGRARDLNLRARAVGSPGAVLNRAFAAAPLARLARASRLVLIVPPTRFTG